MVRVRPAARDDAQAIAEVHVRSWRTAYRVVINDAYLDAMDPSAEVPGLERWLAAEGWFVLEEGGRVIGFAHGAGSRDEDAGDHVADVATIYLDPSAWRKGGGRTLLDALLHDLRSRGFREATLWVLDRNDSGRRFYEALGWSADGASKQVKVGEQTLDEVRYRRPL